MIFKFNPPRPLCALLASAMLLCLSSRSHADDVDLHQLLHGPQRCDHVIGLLMRHGVNNDATATSAVPAFHPLGQVAIPMAELGDLQLVSIARHEIAAGCGPAFDLVIKNCSARDVCGARVTVVGLLGRIHPTCPSTTVKIDSLPAGQDIQITITLPIEALAMGNFNGQMIGMNRVLVVVDSFDQFMESDEANNLRLFNHADVPMVVAASVEVATESTTVAQPIQSGTATTPTPAPATPQSVPAETPSAETGSDVTENDLRSAINQFSEGATTQQDAP